MQEWVDTLRLKLREMKILSPKENFYSKLPEARPPLLPTRDPMSPLPATPAIPAAIVPGVERIVPVITVANIRTAAASTSNANVASLAIDITASEPAAINPSHQAVTVESVASTAEVTTTTTASIPSTSMSNMLTQNLINMLSNPVSAYNNQLSESEASSLTLVGTDSSTLQAENELTGDDNSPIELDISNRSDVKNDNLSSLAKTFANNVLSDPNTVASTSGLSSYVGHSSIKHSIATGSGIGTAVDEGSSEPLTSSIFQNQEPIVIPR